MKKYLPYSLILAAAATGLAHGAATAYTTPVGYVTSAIPANSDTTIAPSLAPAPLLQAASTAVAGNVITVAATGAASGAFINSLPDLNSKTYVLVRTGPLAGLRFPVTGNSATTITVEGGASTLQAQGFVTGNTFSVVPYWTLGTLFPGGVGVGASQDIFDPRAFLIVSDQEGVGTNRGAAKLYFYADGSDSNPAGWRDANDPEGAIQNTVALDPSITYIVRSGSVAQSLTVSGEVPSTVLATKVVKAATANDEYLSSPFPIDTSLAQSGLQSVIAASSDIFDPTEFVLTYDDAAVGFNKGASAIYFYHNGADGFDAGWRDANDPEGPLVTAAVLKAGRAFTLRKSAGVPATLTWSAPLPYAL